MKVLVRFFGSAAETTGRQTRAVDVPDGSTVQAVLETLELRLPRSVRIAVNAEYAARTTRLRAGDAVSIIPPVGGG